VVVIFVIIIIASEVLAQDKPNIDVIMTDNQGYGDLGFYSEIQAETPGIDEMVNFRILFGCNLEAYIGPNFLSCWR
jgi:hypothetical protein